MAEKIALETAEIDAATFEIALTVQSTFDIDSMLADVNITASADAWTLLVACDKASTLIIKTALLETELSDAMVDAMLKITITLQAASD
jgi:hypothetical protein